MTEGDEKAKARQLLGEFLGLSETALFTQSDAVIRSVNRLAGEARAIQRPRLKEHLSRLIAAGAEGRPRKFEKAFKVMLFELGIGRKPRRGDEIEVIPEPAEAADFAPSPSPP